MSLLNFPIMEMLMDGSTHGHRSGHGEGLRGLEADKGVQIGGSELCPSPAPV